MAKEEKTGLYPQAPQPGMYQPVPQTAYQPSGPQMVVVQPGAGVVAMPAQRPLNPSFGCVLAETIIGMFCCCFVCGLIGLIMALVNQTKRDPDTHRWAHYMGIASIGCGVLQWICVVIFVVIMILISVLGAAAAMQLCEKNGYSSKIECQNKCANTCTFTELCNMYICSTSGSSYKFD